MIKSYNNKSNFSSPFNKIYSNLFEKFISLYPFFPFSFIKFIPLFCLSIISCESISFYDLASFIAPSLNISLDSADRRIRRFLSNQFYDFDFFYSKFISFILATYKIKHSEKTCVVTFDHSYINNKYTILMFTLRIGTSSIPLWFKTSPYKDSSLFTFAIFKEAINNIHNMLKSIDINCTIIFLADRWFGNYIKILELIDSLGDIYIIRTKSNTIASYYDEREKHYIHKPLSEFNSYVHHSAIYKDIYITKKRFRTNLVISKSNNQKEAWYILTNGDPSKAIKNYAKRFSSIEFLFKVQKTNGFFLEETQIKNPYTFNSLFTCVCIAQTLATILGIDYTKNTRTYKRYKFRTCKMVNSKRKRDISYFRIGCYLIKYAIFSSTPFNLFKRLILYDI